MKFVGGIKMLEQLITGVSKTTVFAGKELAKGITTAKAELNPQFLKQQAGAIAKFELMKAKYVKQNGSATASIDMQATKMFQEWMREQQEQEAMANEMFKSFTQPAPVQEKKTYTEEEVQAMLAKLNAQKEENVAV